MDLLIDLLNNIKIIGPLGIVACVEAYAIYVLFNKLEEAQEQRLNDWKQMRDEYTKLSEGINSTLDTVLKIIGRKNGNGSCDK